MIADSNSGPYALQPTTLSSRLPAYGKKYWLIAIASVRKKVNDAMLMYRPKNSSESSCYGVTMLRYYYGVTEPELGPKKMAAANFTHVVKFRDE